MSDTSECQELPESRDNFNFVQVNRHYLREWRGLTRRNPLSSEILMYLIENMGKTTNAVVCSYVTLTEVTGVSRSSVARAVKTLKDERWIESIKIGNATAYCVNASVFWQKSRNLKKYAIFQATVIASASEQDTEILDEGRQELRIIPFVGKNERVVISDDELPPPDQTDLELD